MRPPAVHDGQLRTWTAMFVRGRWLCLIAAWFAAVTAGYLQMATFDTRPGAASDARSSWPAQTRLTLASEGMTLVMFLHPQCSCSSASLEELQRLRERHPAVSATYLVIVEVGASRGADDSFLVAEARQVPGVILCTDGDGQLARCFGCRTSGHVFVFDATGQLRFDGGITSARGHTGPNAASDAAANAIDSPRATADRMPVFGCPLF